MAAAHIVQRPWNCDESGGGADAGEYRGGQLDVGHECALGQAAGMIRWHEKDVVLVLVRDFRTASQFLEQPCALFLAKGRKHAPHERLNQDRDGFLSAVTETCHDRRLFFIHNDPLSQLDLH